MALELYYTFSVDHLKAQMMAGNYSEIRTFQFNYMSQRFEAIAPQWVNTWSNGSSWSKVSESSLLPSGSPGKASQHSPFAKFSATCMYFAVELIDEKRRLGLDLEKSVPIGLIQSAVGGTQIEEWMPNATRQKCTNLSTSRGGSALFNGMAAPFANYSVAGWVWWQAGLDFFVQKILSRKSTTSNKWKISAISSV